MGVTLGLVSQQNDLRYGWIGPELTIRGCGVARPRPWHVDDELWAVVETLLPKVECRTRHPGRERPRKFAASTTLNMVASRVGSPAGPAGAFLGLTSASTFQARDQEAGPALVYVSALVEDGTAAPALDLHEESPQAADGLARRHVDVLEQVSAEEFEAQVAAEVKAA